MHLSQYPYQPEPMEIAVRTISAALGHLAAVDISQTSDDFRMIRVALHDARDIDVARLALRKIGARDDAARGPSVLGYRGRMICLEHPESLDEIKLPTKTRRTA